MIKDNKQKNILGVKINFLSKEEVLKRVISYLDNPDYTESRLLSTTNPEFIMAASSDPRFKTLINSSFLSVPDGVGVLLAKLYLENVSGNNILVNFFKGLWLGLSLPFKKLFNLPAFNLGERIDGVSLVYDLAAIAEKKGYSIFLLGGWPTNFWGKPLSNPGYDLAEKAGKNLVKLYPNLRLIGATSDFSYKEKEDASTITFIKEKMQKANVEKIDILIVCYGHKNQEKWIARNASKIPARLAMGAGGSFDYISGEKSWAPKWIKELHVEWLYRLITQPWRLKRVFMSFPVFPIKVFLHSLKPRN